MNIAGRRYVITNEQVRDLYNQGFSSYKIGRILGVDHNAVLYRGNRMGLKFERPTIKCESLDLPLSADESWVLGLMGSDGCITKYQPGRSSTVIFVSKDEDLADKIIHIISVLHKYNHYIGERRYFRAQCANKELVGKLMNLGISCGDKTHTLRPPDLSQIKVSHYVRGLFDGDGCVYCEKTHGNKGKKYLAVAYFSCSRSIMEFLADMMDTVVNKKPNINKSKTQSAYRIRLINLHALKWLEWMYQGSTESNRLNRKYERFEELRALAESRR